MPIPGDTVLLLEALVLSEESIIYIYNYKYNYIYIIYIYIIIYISASTIKQ